MNKNIKVVLFLLLALLLPSFVSAQVGTNLTSTTLSATISAGVQSFQLASVAGISGFGPGINSPTGGTVANGNITDLYIDRELFQVVSVNVTARTVVVLRGQGGSQTGAHVVGSIVIIGTPSAFIDYDPSGYCGTLVGPAINQQFNTPPIFNPWINQRTSNQWICSTTSSVWVPGLGNPGVSGTPVGLTTLVASAAALVPSGQFFHVSGAVAIVNINAPVGNHGSVTIIFDGVDTWTAAGNISIAGTNTTAGTSVTFTWDPGILKWVPSRVA